MTTQEKTAIETMLHVHNNIRIDLQDYIEGFAYPETYHALPEEYLFAAAELVDLGDAYGRIERLTAKLGEKSRGYVYYAVALVIDLEAARNRICNPIVEYRDGEYIDSLGCIITCWLNGTLSSGEENFAEFSENLAEMGIDYVTAYDFLRNEELRDSFEREFVLTAPDEYDYGKDMELDAPFRRPWEADYVNFAKNWDKDRTIAENARWYTETQKDEIRYFFTYEEEMD